MAQYYIPLVATPQIVDSGGGSGSGGSGAGGVTFVNGEYDENDKFTLDIKAGQLFELLENGIVFVKETGSAGASVQQITQWNFEESVGYRFYSSDYDLTAPTENDYPFADNGSDM